MILYIIPLLVSFYGAVTFDLNNRKRGYIILMLFLFVYMTLFLGLRYGVGGDTINYMNDYAWVPDLSNYTFISVNRYEPGFNLLMSIGKSFSEDFVGFQLLHVGIFNILLFIAFRKSTPYFFFAFFCSLFIFYYYFTTEILRESLSAIFFFFLYKFMIKKQWLLYFFGVFLCCSIHISALFLIFLPMLTWIKFNSKYIILVIGLVIVGFLIKPLLSTLSSIMLIGEGISSYQDSTTHGYFADMMNLLRLSIFPILFSLLIKYKTSKGGDLKYENMIAIMTLLGIMTFFNPIIFSRLCNYFKIFFTIAFSYSLITMMKWHIKTIRRNAIIIFMTFIIIYGSEFIFYNYYTRLIPYYSIFDPVLIERNNFIQ